MTEQTPAPSAYTDVAGLAARLGIDPATVRQHIKSRPAWLPAPTKLAGRWVWLTADVAGIEKDQRRRPGRPSKASQPSTDAPA